VVQLSHPPVGKLKIVRLPSAKKQSQTVIYAFSFSKGARKRLYWGAIACWVIEPAGLTAIPINALITTIGGAGLPRVVNLAGDQ